MSLAGNSVIHGLDITRSGRNEGLRGSWTGRYGSLDRKSAITAGGTLAGRSHYLQIGMVP
jgi:hypothetical protein